MIYKRIISIRCIFIIPSLNILQCMQTQFKNQCTINMQRIDMILLYIIQRIKKSPKPEGSHYRTGHHRPDLYQSTNLNPEVRILIPTPTTMYQNTSYPIIILIQLLESHQNPLYLVMICFEAA